nr:dihydrodipicolinate synthase family protein [Campylobacter jejuni]
MDKNIIIGAMTALITPFKNGKVDEQSYARLIKRQIENGIDAVVPVGTTGESATLTHEEHRTCIEIAVETCKGTKVKVLAGAGSNATHEAVGLAKFAKEHGADGILSVAPYYNNPLDGSRLDEFKTRGCIALFNNNLEKFAKVVQDKKVFVMTEEKEKIRAKKDQIASLLADLFTWKLAWTNSDTNAYLSFYDEQEFKRFDKMKFEQFASMKKSIFSRKEDKKIKFSDINISPYPNLENETMYRISFYEDYYTKNYRFRGDKILYVKIDSKGKMKILAEQ